MTLSRDATAPLVQNENVKPSSKAVEYESDDLQSNFAGRRIGPLLRLRRRGTEIATFVESLLSSD